MPPPHSYFQYNLKADQNIYFSEMGLAAPPSTDEAVTSTDEAVTSISRIFTESQDSSPLEKAGVQEISAQDWLLT